MKRWAIPFLVLLLLPGCTERPVLVAGSSCMGRMMAALAEGYAERYGKAVEVQLGGTELGLLALREGGCDLASCSRDPEGYGGIDAFAVAVDAIAVVVHPSNPVASVSLSELRGIYAGEITDWKELGASPAPIVVIGREAGSGTRLAFEQAIGLTTSATRRNRTKPACCGPPFPSARARSAISPSTTRARAQESEAFPSRERFPARELCAPDAIR